MKRLPAIVIALALVLALAVGGWFAWRNGWLAFLGLGGADAGGTVVAGQGGTEDEDNVVHALGRLQPSGGILMISALPGDRVKELSAQVGTEYEADATLAVMDSYSLRMKEVETLQKKQEQAVRQQKAELQVAEAQVKAAQAAKKQAEAKAKEVEARSGQIDVLQANLMLEREKLETLRSIGGNVVSAREIRQQQLLVQKLEAEKEAALTMLSSARETAAIGIEAAQANIDAAVTARDQILATDPADSMGPALAASREQMWQSIVKAPVKGTVLKINTRQGERIANQPILQMANLREMVCIAEVFENQARWVEAGDEVVISSDAFGRVDAEGESRPLEIHGVVDRKDMLVGDPQLQQINPFQTVDNHVVEVRIRIREEDAPLAAQYVNLQVDVSIQVDKPQSAR